MDNIIDNVSEEAPIPSPGDAARAVEGCWNYAAGDANWFVSGYSAPGSSDASISIKGTMEVTTASITRAGKELAQHFSPCSDPKACRLIIDLAECVYLCNQCVSAVLKIAATVLRSGGEVTWATNPDSPAGRKIKLMGAVTLGRPKMAA